MNITREYELAMTKNNKMKNMKNKYVGHWPVDHSWVTWQRASPVSAAAVKFQSSSITITHNHNQWKLFFFNLKQVGWKECKELLSEQILKKWLSCWHQNGPNSHDCCSKSVPRIIGVVVTENPWSSGFQGGIFPLAQSRDPVSWAWGWPQARDHGSPTITELIQTSKAGISKVRGWRVLWPLWVKLRVNWADPSFPGSSLASFLIGWKS